jgi:DNA-binding winged helix-turn-helix (wHTH) protein
VRLQFDDVTFDANARQLWLRGEEVRLSRKAFELLALLIERRPDAVSKDEIRAHLWPETFVSESSIPSLMSEIRTALADQDRDPHMLRTHHGFGYAFQWTDKGVAAKPAAEATPAAWLVGSGGEIPLAHGENVLGRMGGDVGIVPVPSTSVSRRHARIVIDARGATVEDLGSKNGTYVNDRRVLAPTALANSDQLRLGSVVFTFMRAESASTTATVPSSITGGPRLA